MTVSCVVKVSEVIAEVARLCQAFPAKVYERPETLEACQYTGDAAGSGVGHGCLVGQALRNVGIPEQRLAMADVPHTGEPACQLVRKLVEEGLCEGTSDEGAWLSDIQSYQDCGYTWGECFGRIGPYSGGERCY